MRLIRTRIPAIFILCTIAFRLSLGNPVQESDPLQSLKTILREIAVYKYNDSRSWLNDFRNVMIEIYTSPDLKGEAETMMIEFLESGATVDGKHFICHQLGPDRKSVV